MGLRTARLRLQLLEDRAVPATLLTSVLGNGDTNPVFSTSTDGRYVLFASKATNLVPGVTDTNNDFDLFWLDTATNIIQLVSHAAGSATAVGIDPGANSLDGSNAIISGDGQFVAFASKVSAETLVGGSNLKDTADSFDVFTWAAATNKVQLVSIRTDGQAAGLTNGTSATSPAISSDGRYVSFLTNAYAGLLDPAATLDQLNTTFDIFRHDALTGATTLVTAINGSGAEAVGQTGSVRVSFRGQYMSNDGRFFAYDTQASGFVVAGVTDQSTTFDVFVRDMNITGTGTKLVSVAQDGKAIGNNGNQAAAFAVISDSGNAVLFDCNVLGGTPAQTLVAGYINNGATSDQYVRLNPFSNAGMTVLVSGSNGSPTVGANADIVLNGGADQYTLSADGRFVLFTSEATNLVPNTDRNNKGSDGFVRDTQTLATTVVSIDGLGATGSSSSIATSISSDGRFVTFVSAATDLVAGLTDLNGASDLFIRDLVDGTTKLVSATPSGRRTGNGPSPYGQVTPDGKKVLFVSTAGDLNLPASTGGTVNLYAGSPSRDDALTQLTVSGQPNGVVKTYQFDDSGSAEEKSLFTPFTGFNGVVRAATGDLNGDGVADTVYATGPGGGALVRAISGLDGTDLLTGTLVDTFAGENFTTIGLYLAVGDINGDGKAEIAVSPDQGGGARIQVFSFSDGALVQAGNFFGIDDAAFRGGGRIALGDVNGDSVLDLVVGAGFGGGPRIAIFDGTDLLTSAQKPAKLVGDFLVFEPGLRDGVFVSAGDLDGDGKADLIFGGGPGGGPRVSAFSGADTINDGALPISPIANFFAFDASQRGGVRVTAKDVDGDDQLDLIAASGDNAEPGVVAYLGSTLPLGGQGTPPVQDVFVPFSDAVLLGGVFVG
jgi:hypothetical protein